MQTYAQSSLKGVETASRDEAESKKRVVVGSCCCQCICVLSDIKRIKC